MNSFSADLIDFSEISYSIDEAKTLSAKSREKEDLNTGFPGLINDGRPVVEDSEKVSDFNDLRVVAQEVKKNQAETYHVDDE